MLKDRVIPGLAMALLWLLLLLYGSFFFFWLVMVVAGIVGLAEYHRMTGVRLAGSGSALLLLAASLLPVLTSCGGSPAAVTAGLFAGFFCVILLHFQYYDQVADILSTLGISALGMVYIALALAHLVLLRALPDGGSWLIVLTAITAGSDTGAYFAGIRFGRTKLCPVISPGKTVAGVVGGLLAGIATGLLFCQLLLPSVSSWKMGLAAGLLVVVGICGDLAESVVKRAAGVKDSGAIFAGHGGLLDRIDSLLFAGPVLFYLLLFGGLP